MTCLPFSYNLRSHFAILAHLAMDLAKGTQLGHYEILSPIGKGGMGEVYLAEDTRLKRRVALKLLPAQFTADRDRVRRFEQEARAASALNHPNIITIHEIGEIGKTLYLVTEFVEGETLRERLSQGLMEFDTALEVTLQSASALAAAHEAGIVHRDIKPDNIMLRRDGLLKVLDFGLAKLAETGALSLSEEALTAAMLSTEAGVVMGTPLYMSPEQARGVKVDARSDIFSLGVVLYETITGRTPFEGETSSDVIAAILKTEPVLPGNFNRGIPAELERIVSKTLAKDREERYQTAKDLMVDLRRLKKQMESPTEIKRTASAKKPQNEIAVQIRAARPSPSVEYLAGEIRKHKLSFAAAALVLLCTVAGLGYWFINSRLGSNSPEPIESIAVLPFVNESGNSDVEYLSDGITETLIKSLSQLPKLMVKARSSVFRYKGKEVESQQVGTELKVQAVLSGRVVQLRNDLRWYLSLVDARTGNQLWGEQYNSTLTDLVALQSEIVRDVSEKLRLRLTNAEQQRLTRRGTENAEALRAYLKGLYYWNKGPGPGYEKSGEYFQQAITLDPSYALAHAGLADYYGFASAGSLLPPNENWPKAEAAVNKALELDKTLAEAYNPLAAVKLYYYRDWPAAEREFRRGLDLNPNAAEIHIHYALCLALFGRNEQALAEVQRALELEESPRLNEFWARVLYFMREYDRAIDQFRKTLDLDPNLAAVHESLGDAYEQKGMLKEAIAEWSRALTLSGAGELASGLERTYAAAGFEATVRALAQHRLEKLDERSNRAEYVPAFEYVTAYTRLGDKEKALAWFTKAAEERNGFPFLFKVIAIYDKLREDPRFQESLRRVGL